MKKPLRPAEHAEAQLLEAIVNQEFPPGTVLPAERILASTLGVTRPTLRETLQRLATKGWISINQGKPTRVNNYLENGGLALLGSMLEYEKGLTPAMVENLLKVRLVILPGIAQLAATRDPECLCDYLKTLPGLNDDPGILARYDWDLHLLMVKLTDNPVFKFIFNDFTSIFQTLGEHYFLEASARQTSLDFYRELFLILKKNHDLVQVEQCVKTAMAKSIEIWQSRIGDNF